MVRCVSAIEVRDLWQAYSVQWVLRNVSFSVRPGELTVLTGVNGVGKTTLLEAIAGVRSATRGSVCVNGFERRSTVESELAARRTSVYLPSDVFLPAGMTVVEYLHAASSLFCDDFAVGVDRIEKLLDLFALSGSSRQLTRSLSAGQKKKLGLISALLADRDVLLLDEPFSGGLDPAGILAVKRVLRSRSDRGQTILMTTPVTEYVAEVADRLLVLRDGELIHDLTREELVSSAGTESGIVQSLEAIVFPDIHRRVDDYLASMTAERSAE